MDVKAGNHGNSKGLLAEIQMFHEATVRFTQEFISTLPVDLAQYATTIFQRCKVVVKVVERNAHSDTSDEFNQENNGTSYVCVGQVTQIASFVECFPRLLSDLKDLQKSSKDKESHVFIEEKGFSNNEVLSDNSFKCPLCEFITISSLLFRKHINEHKTTDRLQNKQVMGYDYVCKACKIRPFKTTILSCYIRHMNTLHSECKLTLCEICGQSFNRPDNLLAHKKLIHFNEDNTKATCQECGKTFNYKYNLLQHRMVHIRDKRFPCDICGNLFKSAQSRDKHIHYAHTNPKKFSCSYCNKGFSTKQRLQTHTSSKHASCKSSQDEIKGSTSSQASKECDEHDRFLMDVSGMYAASNRATKEDLNCDGQVNSVCPSSEITIENKESRSISLTPEMICAANVEMCSDSLKDNLEVHGATFEHPIHNTKLDDVFLLQNNEHCSRVIDNYLEPRALEIKGLENRFLQSTIACETVSSVSDSVFINPSEQSTTFSSSSTQSLTADYKTPFPSEPICDHHVPNSSSQQSFTALTATNVDSFFIGNSDTSGASFFPFDKVSESTEIFHQESQSNELLIGQCDTHNNEETYSFERSTENCQRSHQEPNQHGSLDNQHSNQDNLSLECGNAPSQAFHQQPQKRSPLNDECNTTLQMGHNHSEEFSFERSSENISSFNKESQLHAFAFDPCNTTHPIDQRNEGVHCYETVNGNSQVFHHETEQHSLLPCSTEHINHDHVDSVPYSSYVLKDLHESQPHSLADNQLNPTLHLGQNHLEDFHPVFENSNETAHALISSTQNPIPLQLPLTLEHDMPTNITMQSHPHELLGDPQNMLLADHTGSSLPAEIHKHLEPMENSVKQINQDKNHSYLEHLHMYDQAAYNMIPYEFLPGCNSEVHLNDNNSDLIGQSNPMLHMRQEDARTNSVPPYGLPSVSNNDGQLIANSTDLFFSQVTDQQQSCDQAYNYTHQASINQAGQH